MKLWTKEIERKAEQFPIGSQEQKGLDAIVIAKFFNPYGSGTILVLEAEKQEDGDYLLFTYSHIFEWEYGYTMLSEILNTKVNFFGCQLPLERDLYIAENATVRDLAQGY